MAGDDYMSDSHCAAAAAVFYHHLHKTELFTDKATSELSLHTSV